ncbi:hypothetical protein ACFE04_007316 [Oxalis oulophora]
MHPNLFSLSIAIILIVNLNFPASLLAYDYRYTNCSQPFSCGGISDVTYPFWGGDRPEYCGLSGLELTCEDDDIPRILMEKKTKYRIIEFSSNTRTLTVVRDDYYGTVCPTFFSNSSIDFSNFNYASNLSNITIFYKCSNAFALISVKFNCEINTTTLDAYAAIKDSEINQLIGASCSSSVKVTVANSAADAVNDGEKDVVEAINGGFGLQWKSSTDCHTCMGSGGSCGFNSSLNSFACFCYDQPSNTTCSSKPPGSNSGTQQLGIGKSNYSSNIFFRSTVGILDQHFFPSLGLGIGIPLFAGVLLGAWYMLKRKKKKDNIEVEGKLQRTPYSSQDPIFTPSVNLSQSTVSYPSSNLDLESGSSYYFGAQVFHFSELEEATENFNPSKEVGDGGFGTVYYGKLKDGRVVAVKRLHDNNFKRAEQFMNEIEILTHVRHPNLVTLYGCTSRQSRELLLVYEYVPNGTIADHIHKKQEKSGLLPWPTRFKIALETATALAYLHASDIIHRDVKSNNILLDHNFSVKVADFGLSRLFPINATHVSTAPQGTPGYVDPEYHQFYQLTDKSDVYSFGVVLIELISSKEAVDITRGRHDINLASMAISRIQNDALHELVDPRLGFEKDNDVKRSIMAAAELAFRCLQKEREMRPLMSEVVVALRDIEK